jgi:hypothetical protein
MAATCDAVAEDYAAAFAGELAGKPFDRSLLGEFAAAVRDRGQVQLPPRSGLDSAGARQHRL